METSSTSTVWYFAYGSNMSPSILTDKRGIHPRRALLVRCSDYALAFNVPGVPFLEPAMAGLRQVRPTKEGKRSKGDYDRANLSDEVAVHGIAYEISSRELDKIFATEGGGIAYQFANVSVEVLRTLNEGERPVEHECLDVVTLVARKPIGGRRPSVRYLNLLLAATKDNRFPKEYCEMLGRVHVYQRTPAPQFSERMFMALWLRVQGLIQWAIIRFRNEQGMVPSWFIVVFDLLVIAMWFHHDYLHAPSFGRGD